MTSRSLKYPAFFYVVGYVYCICNCHLRGERCFPPSLFSWYEVVFGQLREDLCQKIIIWWSVLQKFFFIVSFCLDVCNEELKTF